MKIPENYQSSNIEKTSNRVFSVQQFGIKGYHDIMSNTMEITAICSDDSNPGGCG